MAQWTWEYQQGAEDDLASLDRSIRRRVIEKLDWLAENFEKVIPLPLGGEYIDFYKLRVGAWRIVYKIDWQRQAIIVCYIDRRDKIYKKR